MTLTYPFTHEQLEAAWRDWHCNCGPTALAFALQTDLDTVHAAIPGFDEKRYTSPSMMKAALASLGRSYFAAVPEKDNMFKNGLALVRVQWTGPWTAPGANPKWAYGMTHWIATWLGIGPNVFDVNCGMGTFEHWEKVIVPQLTATYPRADGGWLPTHIWRLEQR